MLVPPLRSGLLRRIRLSCALLVALVGGAPRLSAQITLTHTEDAAPIPAGYLRFRIVTGWSRYDERFTGFGTQSLGDEISADSLGPRQFPLLQPVENGLKTLTGNPNTRLTFGKLAAQSDAYTVTTPIVFEYGVTNRFSVGLMFPVVQTRRSIHFTMNADSSRSGNASFVPVRSRGVAATTNSAVYNAYLHAADSLTTLITKCPSTPTASGCAAVNANIGAATATRDDAQRFATAVRTSLGIDTTTTLVAPLAGSSLASAIDTHKSALNTQLQQFLGSTAGTTASVFTSVSVFSYVDLQGKTPVAGFMQSPLGGPLDSLQTTNKLALGGVTLAAQWMLQDNFARDTLPPPAWQTRIALGAQARFESLPIDSARTLGTISPARGSGVTVHTAMDFWHGRFGGTIVAQYDKSFARTIQASVVGNPEAFYPFPTFAFVPRTLGDVVTLDLTPRYLLSPWFSIDGVYGYERTGASTYSLPADDPANPALFTPNPNAQVAQRIGFGFRYSTVDAYLRGATKTPVEVSYTHLETISGDLGTNKIFRDQIQLRIYVNLFGKH